MNKNVKTDITIADRVAVITEVANVTVSRELGYVPIIEKLMYRYAILKHFGNVDPCDGRDFSLDAIDNFIRDHKTDLDELICIVDPDGELENACHDAIMYRVRHCVGNLVDDLLLAVINWVNNVANQEVDMDVVTSLKDLIPVLRDMDTGDVAKAIIAADKKIVTFPEMGVGNE